MTGIRVTGVTQRGSQTTMSLVDNATKKMLLDLHAGLVQRTPVDTGRARGGWTVDTSAGVIENNVEYVDALNAGHSKQAPAGWIEAEIDRATRL